MNRLSIFGVPHGLACAVFLPQYLKEAEKANPELYNELMSAMNIDFESLNILFSDFCSFDFNISDEQISSYVDRWATLKNFKNSPTDFNNEDAGKLVQNLFQK